MPMARSRPAAVFAGTGNDRLSGRGFAPEIEARKGRMSFAPHDIVPQAGQAAREVGSSSAPARPVVGPEKMPRLPRHAT